MSSPHPASRSLILVCAMVYLLVVSALFFQARCSMDGHFLYALDDPYIHLALSEQIAQGHYGINPGEPASPSSSAIWPLLLVPFSSRSWHMYLPLFWNILFGLAASCLIAVAVSRWPPQPGELPRMAWWKKLVTALLLMAIANLFSLTMLGMEHVLQVLIAIACAFGLMEALDGNEIPSWCLAAAAAGPMVRYENLSLTLAVCVALAAQSRLKKAATVFLLSLITPIGFGLFLKSLGLTFLPNSVLVKARLFNGHTGTIDHAVWTLVTNIYFFFHSSLRWPMALLAVLLMGAFFKERDRVRRRIYAAAALVPVLQLLIGRFGWFHRYEVFAVIFSTLLVMHFYSRLPHCRFACLAVALLLLAAPYLKAVADTAAVSTEVYRQQYQVARFAHDFYKQSVAVNDIGLTSYRRPPGVYILDVFGLGSREAAQQTDKTSAWLHGIVQRHNVKLAILYREWFDMPKEWVPLAQMCLPRDPIVIGERCVVFYSTSTDQREQIRAELQHFSATLPPEVVYIKDPHQIDSKRARPPAY